MAKMTISAAAFAAAMLMGIVPGYCGNSAVREHNLNHGTDAAKPAPSGQIDAVNVAAGNPPRQIVDGADAGDKPAR